MSKILATGHIVLPRDGDYAKKRLYLLNIWKDKTNEENISSQELNEDDETGPQKIDDSYESFKDDYDGENITISPGKWYTFVPELPSYIISSWKNEGAPGDYVYKYWSCWEYFDDGDGMYKYTEPFEASDVQATFDAYHEGSDAYYNATESRNAGSIYQKVVGDNGDTLGKINVFSHGKDNFAIIIPAISSIDNGEIQCGLIEMIAEDEANKQDFGIMLRKAKIISDDAEDLSERTYKIANNADKYYYSFLSDIGYYIKESNGQSITDLARMDTDGKYGRLTTDISKIRNRLYFDDSTEEQQKEIISISYGDKGLVIKGV